MRLFRILSLATTWIFGFTCAFALVALLYTIFLGREFVVPGERIYNGIEDINTPGTKQIAGMEGYGITTYGEDGLVVNKPGKSNRKTVLFWGDSFVEAIQVSDQYKFTEIVEQKWNTAYPDRKIQTLNIGQAGLDNRAYIQFSENVDDLFSPDLVFLMVGSSDFEPLAQRNELEQKLISGEFDGLLRPANKSNLRRIINDIGLHSFAARLKRQTFAFLNNTQNEKKDIDQDALNEYQFQRSTAIQLKALKNIWGERLVILYRHRVSDYGELTSDPKALALYNALIDEDIEFIDTHKVLSKAMQEGNPPHGFANYNLGQGHFNQTGHLLVADLVINYMAATE